MTLKTLAAAACISLATATMATSAPVTLGSRFGDGIVVFHGLDDADGLSAATSFDLYLEYATWRGLSVNHAELNGFEFSNGDLVEGAFLINLREYGYPLSNDRLPYQFAYLNWTTVSARAATYLRAPGGLQYVDDRWGVTWRIDPISAAPLSAVPLPAGGLLLLSAFGGVAALKRRKKRAA